MGPWTAEENERLREMVAQNISVVRAAAVFRRSIKSVRVQGRKLGVRFPSIVTYRKKMEASFQQEARGTSYPQGN
jgi:hypothetical protein